MTNAASAAAERRVITLPVPRPAAVIFTAICTFLILVTFLSLQLRAGKDPAVGAGTAVTAPATQQVSAPAQQAGPSPAPVTKTS